MTENAPPDFPRPTLDDWRAEAERVLRGQPLSSVTWTTEDGVEVPPVVAELTQPAPPTPTRSAPLRTCTTADSDDEIADHVEAGFDLVRICHDHEEDLDALRDLDLSHVLLSPVSPSEAIPALEDLPSAAGVLLGLHGWMWAIENATPAQQIGWVLSAAVDVLTEVDEDHAGRLFLEVPVGAQLLTEVAKLRALRRAWTEIAAERELPGTLLLVASFPSFPFTRMDAESNLLRATLAGFAAITGGADVLEPARYRDGRDPVDEARLALNQVRLMLEESSLDAVSDPFAGSGTVESLTAELAGAGRAEFDRLRALGGFMEASATGDQERLAEMVEPHGELDALRADAIARRQLTVVGVNRFADPTHDADATHFEDPESVFGAWADPGTSLAEEYADGVLEFEYLRDRMLWHQEAGHARPTVLLLPLGPVRWRRARADFAADFFRAGGFAIDDPGGFTSITAALDRARESGSPIVVVCSDDDSYAELAPEIVGALTECLVYVAGRPPEGTGADAWGATAFIFEGAHAIDLLCDAQDRVGVRRLP